MAVVNGNGNGNGNNDSVWPPGFRFHPTDEELVLYYLKRKICRRKIKLNIIREMDVYKWDPEELPGQALLKTGDRQWFFFSPRDRKYPNGARSNRATRQGYWKATGKDRIITCNSRNVGVKKTLVFYRGRAPNGERTDWVMHEYTMDEVELSRCPNVQDYFALYKVFKKSGPGPKNGEQYGAPFKEEEWADDECGDVKDSVTVDSFANQPVEVPCDNNDRVILPIEKSVDELDELDELLKQFADVPELDILPPTFDAYPEPQVSGQITAGNSLLSEVTFSEPDRMLLPRGPGHEREASFDFSQATASMLPLDGAPEVMSAHNNFDEAPQLTVEDYLEIDDLTGSLPTFANIEGAGDNLPFDGFGEHCAVYLPQDGEVFLHDPNQTREESFSFNMTSLDNEMGNQVGYSVQPFLGTNQDGIGMQLHSVESEADFEFQPESFFDDEIANQLRMIGQPNGSFSSAIQGSLSQSDPGVEYPVASNPHVANRNVNGEPGNGVNSRFASSMWSFLESMPSNPASASEIHLVNKALMRMSSFSRLRMNGKSPNAVVGNGAGNGRKAGGSRSFVVLSILGALCAILWVYLMGSKVLLGRLVSS